MALLTAVGRQAVSLPDRAAHALLIRDLNGWLRLEFVGVASRTGIVDALAEPATVESIAARAGITDVDLLEALLQLGVALRELHEHQGRYVISGRRLRAIAGRSIDLRGLVEEVVGYDSPIYTSLGEHLHGAAPRDYLHGVGDVIAQASRIAEPLLAPSVRAVVASTKPARILDVGCGSGLYLQHALESAGGASAVGIDLDADAIAAAERTLAGPIAAGRCELRTTDLDDLDVTDADQPFDLVLLLNNIYYWPPEQRAGVLARLRGLAPTGTVVVATATPTNQVLNRHLDIVLRVTQGSWRLPTASELVDGLRGAGFPHVDLVEPVPRAGVVVAIGS
jgi:SAM-dependent methyltransferase